MARAIPKEPRSSESQSWYQGFSGRTSKAAGAAVRLFCPLHNCEGDPEPYGSSKKET